MARAFTRSAVVLALCTLASLVLGGITPLVSLRLRPGQVVYQRVGVYSKNDSPLGHKALSLAQSQPYALWDLRWSVEKAASPVNFTGKLGEIVLMHHKWRPSFGHGGRLIEEKYFCCTSKLYSEGKCTTPRQLIFPSNLNFRDPSHSADGLLEYHSFLPADYSTDQTHPDREMYEVHKSGVYYLFLANCQEDSDLTLYVDGQIKWVNPYGYLPAQILGYLPAYWILFVLYTIVCLWYVALTIRHLKDLLGLQILVLTFLLVAWMENLIWGCDYIVYNNNGIINDIVNVFGALFTSLKATLILLTVLMCALGYSITKPVLRKRVVVAVTILTLAFFVVLAVTQYLLVAQTAGAYVSDEVKLVFEVVKVLLMVSFGVWIVISLFNEMRSLKSNSQLEKYKLYSRLIILLVVAAIIAVIFAIAQAAATFADYEDESFRVWWLWDTYWEFVYFAVALAIAIIWRPNENNKLYAFSEQIPNEDFPTRTDANEVQLEVSERPSAPQDSSSSSYDSKSSSS